MLHSEVDDALGLLAVSNTAVIFAPRGLLRVAEQIGSRDVVVMADFRTAEAAKELFRPIGAGAFVAVGFLVVDAAHLVAGVQCVS